MNVVKVDGSYPVKANPIGSDKVWGYDSESLTNKVFEIGKISSKESVNVDNFGAIGDGNTDDTIAFNLAVANSPNGSVIVGTKGKTYLITTISINKEIHLDLTGISIIRSTGVNVGGESHIITTSPGNYYVTVRGGNIEFTGSIDNAVNGKINGINFQNDDVFVNGTKIEGCSWCGIQSELTVKKSIFIAVESHNNGYAGIWSKGNDVIGLACHTDYNGGYNGIDGYGFVTTHQTESENEYFILTSCRATGNMSRGLDCHSSRGSVIFSSCHAINNGAPNPKWGNVVIATARQIHCVNRFNSCQIKDNYVRSEFGTGSLINVTAEASFTFGLKLLDIQGNTCDVLNNNEVCYGISVQYKLTEKLQISNNIVKHSGADQIYSIAIEGVPGSDGWFKDAIIFNNNCDRGLTFRSQNPHPTDVQNIVFGNNTVSQAFIRLQESTGVVNLKISNVVVKERQIAVYGHTNLLSNCTIDNCDVDAVLDTGAFEGGIYLLNINGKVSHTKVKNSLAQGILATGGRVDAVNCDVIKANRGKLSASHAGIDVTGSIEGCYVDNEDVSSAGTAYGYGYRCSAYDMSKTFSGNRIKIPSTSFARMDMSAIGLGTNVIFSTGVKLNPNDKEFRLNYELNPNGIFRFLDEVHDDNPNIIEHALKSICVSAIDRTLISTSAAASTNVNVDSTGLEVGDRVGLLLDDSTYHWTTVSVIVDTNNITVSSAIPTGRSASAAVYFRRWRGFGYSRTNFPNLTPMLNISGVAGSGNALPRGVNWVNVSDGLSNNYPSNLGTSLVVKENNNRTFELFANTEGIFWMRSLHGDATDNIWHRLAKLSETIPDAPSDGNFYVRRNGAWEIMPT
jgi:hypothetical protein